MIMRLAEMYLIRAEANFRLGTGSGATPLEDLNRIRNRAGLASLLSVTLDNILLERRLELAFEGVRIHDIKRLQGVTGTFLWNDNRLVLPIPLRETNANPNLKQNLGHN
nr:RagB/SusD family nutrient uptake outer membrane protein [Eisenibacter elegans]